MKFSKQVWDQLRAKTSDDLIAALGKDGWVHEGTRGAVQVYRHDDGRRVTVHYQPRKSYGPNLLKGLLEEIGWTVTDMRRLKLIK